MKKKRAAPTKAKSVTKPKKAKNENAVKRPLSAYLYFTKDFREERAAKGLDNSKVNEVAKLAGERWKSMTDEQKKPYNDKAAVDRERYQKEVNCLIQISFALKIMMERILISYKLAFVNKSVQYFLGVI